MELEPKHRALYWWLGMAATVAAWDLARPEDTITSSFRRGWDNPYIRPLQAAVLGVTAAHLMGLIKREHDPFYLIERFRYEDNQT